MSTRRLAVIIAVPPYIKKVFRDAPESKTSEERLWRERVSRMILDALGHTNLTMKPMRHNEAVRYARRWFHGLFESHPDPKCEDNPLATFDAGGIINFERIRAEVLAFQPRMFPEKDDDE